LAAALCLSLLICSLFAVQGRISHRVYFYSAAGAIGVVLTDRPPPLSAPRYSLEWQPCWPVVLPIWTTGGDSLYAVPLSWALALGMFCMWYRRPPRHGHCSRCGYCVTGLTSCPECGLPLPNPTSGTEHLVTTPSDSGHMGRQLP